MKTEFSIMRTRTFFLCLIFLFAGWANISNIQAQVLVGDTSFWFAAPDLSEQVSCGDLDSPMMLLITNGSAQPANVNIWLYNNGTPISVSQTVAANGSWKYDISSANKGQIENPRSLAGSAANYGVHITSNVKVAAYYQILPPCSQDIFSLKGAAALGTQFYVPMIHDSYYYSGAYTEAYDQIDIVATEDNTTVHVTPTQEIRIGVSGSSPAGTEIIRTLNKGQTLKIMENEYQLSDNDISLGGTRITADKPIAVTTTEDLIGRSAAPATGWDVIGDQIVPVSSVGKKYAVVKGFMSGSERVYMIATANGTTISVDDGSATTTSPVLNAGQCWAFDMGNDGYSGQDPDVVTVSANSPIYCYQVTGVCRDTKTGDELGSALLPSIYSVSQTQLSFYSYEAEQTDYNKLFLLFRDGSEGDFTLSYGSTTITPVLTTLPVPGMPEWKAAKYEVPDAARNQVVTVKNTSSMFGAGCFAMNITGGGSSFGYLSAFGTLDFPDTMYKCKGANVTLDAGYGETYIWTLPNGTTLNTSTITVADTGTYSVVVYQDPFTVTASTKILDRLNGVSLVSSGSNEIGAGTYTYSVNLNGQANDYIRYIWRVDGAEVSRNTDSWTTTWTNADEHLITVEVSDTALHCTETLNLIHYKQPDNITDAECYVSPTGKAFTFAKLAESPSAYSINNYNIPLVGDIDNDGLTEIIVSGTSEDNVSTTKLYIFEYKDNKIVHQQTLTTPYFNNVANPYSIAKVDGNDYAAIFLCTDHTKNNSNSRPASDKLKLIKYVYNGSQYVESTRATYSAVTNKEMAQPMITDFNGDGIPEVVTYDKVFNARTMTLLVDGGLLSNSAMGFGFGGHFNNNLPTTESSSMMAIADMDGDGIPEVIGGNSVYKVKITDPSGLSAGNTYTLWSQCNKTGPSGETHNEAVDGATAVADMDGDGLLDVIVTVTPVKRGVSSGGALYIWNPRTKKVMHTDIHTGFPTAGNMFGPSVAFIGDVDNDKQPEICLTAHSQMYAFEYNPVTKRLTQKWNRGTTDTSGATTMSMFDFNQDGNNELVYRDITHLRIINGTDGSDLIPSIPTSSATADEYPVVADINGDGAAEIIVTGGTQIWVYASSPAGLWAPARKVWNQFAYNVVNVNENLSIPQFQMNPATVFSGKDGILGTVDDIRPYNGYLQQQTSLNDNGLPIWLAPRSKTVTPPEFDYDAGIDEATINLVVANIGSAAFQAPFYVTVYKNNSSASLKHVYAHNAMIYDGDTVNMSIVIPDFKASGWIPFDHILVRTNDNGDSYTNQAVCDSTSITRDFTTTSIIAIDDRVMVTKNSVGNRITVSINDLKSCIDPTVEIISGGEAKHGTATVENDSVIFYTPTIGYVGGDTVTYRIYCDDPAEADTADIYIMVMEFPDNISDADCYTNPPPTAWGIKSVWSSDDIVSSWMTPMVGDLNNDSIPEIVCWGTADYFYLNGDGAVRTILIYDGRTHNLTKTITLPENIYMDALCGAAYGLVKIPRNTDSTGLIVVACKDLKLRAYDIEGTPVWTSSDLYGSNIDKDFSVNVSFADFNNDGFPEVYVRNKIYDATNGQLLGTASGGTNTGSAWAHWSHNTATQWQLSAPIAADVTGDQRLELILGNEIYDVNITSRASTVNPVTRILKKTPPAGVVQDGHTQVADFNNDGRPDIFISNRTEAGTGATVHAYVWDVYNDTVSKPISIATSMSGKSIPLIADMDNDGKLEVLIQCGVAAGVTPGNGTTFRYRCYEYDSNTKSFSFVWDFAPSEDSYSNTATLFDFNLDGENEILLTDQSHVRILNAKTGNEINVLAFTENTFMQYPVIADVDADGSADLVAVGSDRLNIFKSSTAMSWAPARKVWNQYMYNAVNINEDLTVPAVQFSPATVLPGIDGLLGTNDDVRPYNNFLQQQTALNTKGTPLWLTPDAKFVGTPVVAYYGDGDSLVIAAELTNIGDASLIAPFYIAAYKDNVTAANKMAIDSSTIALNVDDVMAATVTVRNFSSHTSASKIIVRINDKGAAAYVQQECIYLNNVFEYNLAGLPKAANDTVATLINTAVFIDVKLYDITPAACSSVVPAIVAGTTKGVATTVNDSILYTPNTDFYGVDSLVYSLNCATGKTEAKVYIIVNKPIADTYIGCAGTNVTAGFEMIEDVEYLWYTDETGGLPVGSEMYTRSYPAASEWWVETQYKGEAVAPRFKVAVDAYPALMAVDIEKNDTICYGKIPAQLKAINNPTGGNGSYSYRWQQSSDGTVWTNTDSTGRTFTPPALTSDTYYRLNTTSCTTEPSNAVKIKVYPQSLYNYSDLRIRVCPDAATLINLSKYIDTLAVTSILWKSISPSVPLINTMAGIISTDNLNEYTNVNTFTYTVVNPCVSGLERKVYVERLKPDRMRPLRDTIVVCYRFAEALQLNQIFGIDAAGTWEYHAMQIGNVKKNIDGYVSESTSPTYGGAVIMNGKAIYEDSSINYRDYHENNQVKTVNVIYKTGDSSCLHGKEYTVTIILTQNIMN